ncbi:AraC family transcriptional regulator [uncultured Dokdonia sp.]|uniref:AraC family transcriptional regulator n=1 Tax=uncultured Dokdonia sp. TaxID=575653 RepID=UPI00262466D7|nr:AraC family transcriptional regulator [uncultured Dokdonia sp.]
MARTIFENIVIQHFEKVEVLAFCQYTPIRFFEILHISEGTGSLSINNQKVPFKANQIYILIPNDKYSLEINTSTTITAIKFLTSFFKISFVDEYQTQRKEWFKKIETIFHSVDRASNIIFKTKKEEKSITALFSVLCNEYNDENLKSEVVLKSTLHTILHILSRNSNDVSVQVKGSKIQDIVNYIHYQIHNPEKITKKALAEKFNISENYVSQYFKNKMDIGLKKYILTYKLKLAETRLLHTNLTVSEIAQELGFTDSSHLDKTFIAYRGIPTSAIKQE